MLAMVLVLVPRPGVGVDLPGLQLDHPALADHVWFDDPFGVAAEIKGGNNAPVDGPKSGVISEVLGFIQAGQPDYPVFAYTGFPTTSPFTTGVTAASTSTLLPAFAAGAIVHATSSNVAGPFLQAVLYEPDSVKRTGSNARKSRTLIKQKSYLAFRFGQFAGSGFGGIFGSSVSGGVVLKECKGQLDLRRDAAKGTESARMKVRCSGKSPEVEAVKGRIGTILGKPKNGFDLSRER